MAYIFKPANSKFFCICWVERTPDGKRVWRRRTTGTDNYDEAEELCKTFEAARAKRLCKETVASLLKAAGDSESIAPDVNLTDLWTWYVSHCEIRCAERQQRDRQNKLSLFISWLTETHPELKTVQEISLRIASEYWQALASQGAAASTRNNHLSALHTIWSAIHAPMELPSNPWAAIQRDRSSSIPYQPFTAAELIALRCAAEEFHSLCAEEKFWPAAIEMGYYTGLRLGDIATLEFEELRRDDEFLILVPNKTRHWGDDRVAVHSLSLPWIELLPFGTDGFVWPKAAASYATSSLSAEFSAIATSAGIQLDREPEEGERRNKNVRLKCFHSLRHTFATDALLKGMTESDLRDQGNWSGTDVIHGHYNLAKLELAKKAARKVAEVLAPKETL
ncbi:MAG: hypothetical protein IJJ33_19625 [Victivallales bacterium]|nr:hypothetical protein [Victivallales bacterium]